jgi:hypothetical protein
MSIIYLITVKDPTTVFFNPKVKDLEQCEQIEHYEIDGTEQSCLDAKEYIADIPDSSIIIFLGHGTDKILYGGCDDNLEKKTFLILRDVKVLKSKYIMLLSCKSKDFLFSARKHSEFINAFGFSDIPTDIEEIDHNKKLRKCNIQNDDIENFRDELIDCLDKSVMQVLDKNCSFYEFFLFFRLLLYKKIVQNNKEKKYGVANILCELTQSITYF